MTKAVARRWLLALMALPMMLASCSLIEGDYPLDESASSDSISTEAAAIAYATDTRHKHYGRVVKYTGGVCYYFFYLRHSNNVAVIHDTMEFGIVRNNIYRFKIEAATGPGTPDADPRHPEELKASVYVKKWILVNHPLIYV